MTDTPEVKIAAPPLTLSDVDLGRELRCGKTKARELIMSGEIPSVKVGGLRRVRRWDLEEYLRSLPQGDPENPGGGPGEGLVAA